MRFIDSQAIDRALAYPRLVDILADAFRMGVIAPPRHHHQIGLAGRPEATLLLMPAWTASAPGANTAGRYLGVKSVSVFPDNGARGLPAVTGVYMLMSAETGAVLAVLDATRLTVWRTAAASALAARHLARPDASRMVMVGAGALAPFLIRAHASVRPLREVAIWNRTQASAERMAEALQGQPFSVRATTDLEGAIRAADIVSTATLASEPLVRGAWLAPGCHLDCVGAFRPAMRETDDDAITRARVYVDTRAGALAEAGDILQPIAAGVIGREHVLGELADLVVGTVAGRQTRDDITLFKSVGASLEDLAAAIEVYERTGA